MDNFLPLDANNPISPATLAAFLQLEDAATQIVLSSSHGRSSNSVGYRIDLRSVNQTADSLGEFSAITSNEFSYYSPDTLNLSGSFLIEHSHAINTRQENRESFYQTEVDYVTGQSSSGKDITLKKGIFLASIDPLTGLQEYTEKHSSLNKDIRDSEAEGLSDPIYLSYLLDYSIWARDYDAFKQGFEAGTKASELIIKRLENILEVVIAKVGNDYSGSQFAGGVAENVWRDQVSSNRREHGYQSVATRKIIDSLRERVEEFPVLHKEDAMDLVDDLQLDMQQTPLNKGRIGRRLKRLVTLALCSETIQIHNIELVNRLSEFTKNIITIARMADASTEQVFSVNR